MLAAIEKRFAVRHVVQTPWPEWYRPLGRALKLLSGRRFEYSWSHWYSALAARRTAKALRGARPDVVFSVAFTDMTYLLVDDFPVVTITDALIPDLVNYYEMFQRLSPTAKRKARAAEHKALHGSMLVHLPSKWACRSAVEHHALPEQRLVEIAWGANMPFAERLPRLLHPGPVRLLFVGSHWERKGGPVAVAAAEHLQRMGVACHLDIVGCTSEVWAGDLPPNVTFHGFVDKRSSEGKAKLDAFYRNATFFILPTHAEAYGIVFAEAAHHGLPCLSYATGGVPSVVLDGTTGVLLAEGASGEAFAREIQALIAAPARYAQMSQACLADARQRLNWDVWAERLEAAVRACLADPA
jgi:glycosyltransferase involved in cell wall biosynthesis